MSTFAPFPAGATDAPGTPRYLLERGYRLRPAVVSDMPRLGLLYADTRAGEMAGVPWPAQARQAFLDQQFGLQHQHYLQHFAGADFQAIEHDGQLQGRYYLLRAAPDHLVIDICLMSAHRGRGIGRALIEDSLRDAAWLQRGMGLHVLRANPRARRLYEALGFEVCDSTDTHHRMRWEATSAAG